MKVLVTGGAGYLGSLVCHQLTRKGIAVNVLDSLYYGGLPLLGIWTLPKLTFFHGDIRDPRAVRDAMKDCDCVVHLAALIGTPACEHKPQLAQDVNVAGTRSVIEQLDGRRLIYASTGSSYGKVNGLCTETTPIAPLTVYGRTKAEGEKVVLDADGVALRFSTLFGVSPRMRYDLLINTLCHDAVRTRRIVLFQPSAHRTFYHVADTAHAVVQAVQSKACLLHNCYNVGAAALTCTKLEVGRKIAKVTGCSVEATGQGRDPDWRDYAVDFSRFEREFGLPRWSLDKGIEELVTVSGHLGHIRESISFWTDFPGESDE